MCITLPLFIPKALPFEMRDLVEVSLNDLPIKSTSKDPTAFCCWAVVSKHNILWSPLLSLRILALVPSSSLVFTPKTSETSVG